MSRIIEWVAFPGVGSALPLSAFGDGELLGGRDWVIMKEMYERRPFMLFSHGNGHALTSIWPHMVEFCRRLRLNLVAWEYPGYGQSDTSWSPTIKEVNERADIVWDDLVNLKKINPVNIILAGHSVGSGPTCYLLEKHHYYIHSVFLLSPFSSIKDMCPWYLRWLAPDLYPNEKVIRDSAARIFFAHGDRDEVIPYSMSVKMCRPQDTLFTIKNRHHNGIDLVIDVLDAYSTFLK